jgi:hypothetical protein
MKIIHPTTIADSIFTLIDDAKEHITLVSTGFNFYKWDSFLKRIEHARKRSIKVKFFTNEPEAKESTNSIKEVESIGFHTKLIPKLNTNLYFNEQTAIVSSMNLIYNNNLHLDIAIQTETKEEYDAVMDFYIKNIQPDGAHLLMETNSFLDELETSLQNLFQKNIRLQFDDTSIQINAKGRYKISIVKEKSNCLKMSCLLNKEEYLFFKMNLHKLNKMKLAIELEQDEERYHCLIWGSAYQLQTENLNKILDTESAMLKQYIIDFVIATQDMKLLMQD